MTAEVKQVLLQDTQVKPPDVCPPLNQVEDPRLLSPRELITWLAVSRVADICLYDRGLSFAAKFDRKSDTFDPEAVSALGEINSLNSLGVFVRDRVGNDALQELKAEALKYYGVNPQRPSDVALDLLAREKILNWARACAEEDKKPYRNKPATFSLLKGIVSGGNFDDQTKLSLEIATKQAESLDQLGAMMGSLLGLDELREMVDFVELTTRDADFEDKVVKRLRKWSLGEQKTLEVLLEEQAQRERDEEAERERAAKEKLEVWTRENSMPKGEWNNRKNGALRGPGSYAAKKKKPWQEPQK